MFLGLWAGSTWGWSGFGEEDPNEQCGGFAGGFAAPAVDLGWEFFGFDGVMEAEELEALEGFGLEAQEHDFSAGEFDPLEGVEFGRDVIGFDDVGEFFDGEAVIACVDLGEDGGVREVACDLRWRGNG